MSLGSGATIQPIESIHQQSRFAVALFASTTFIASGLLFLVQPMFAKLLLPRLGGSPSVWNTCVLFFQTTLLLGYLYAHFSTRWLGVRRQTLCHMCLLVAPLVFLPFAAGNGEPAAVDSPVWWLLRTMTVRIGVPFFVVSASAPLLQRWFATLPMASARDPYFLYAASNLGSMLALLSFPLLLEPVVGVRHQTWLWTAGYVMLALGTVSCALVVRGLRGEASAAAIDAEPLPTGAIPNKARWQWVMLAFVPSSLMLGVTTHISTDVAAVPLLWIVPLALYLGTFVLAFATKPVLSQRWLVWLLPALVSACLFSVLANAQQWWLIPLHLATFFACAMVCHGELARRRPDVEHLTEYYIWMSIGGMLGGVFNTLVAPHVFTQILEYPLVLAVAALVRPSPGFRTGRPEPWPVLVWAPLGVLLLCIALWAGGLLPNVGLRDVLVGFGLLAAIGYVFVNRPEPFGIIALVFVAVIAFGRPSRDGAVLFAGRSFFGVHRVVDAPDHSYHLLQHGSTNHGRQDAATASGCEPTGYYHRAGPIGQVFAAVSARFTDIAAVGLGSGALACYAEPRQSWTFYEIDPIVEQIAREPRYFTFLQHSRGPINVVLGDGRLSLQRAGAGAYDLIALDAFSSDAIPVHLLTREAIALYLSRLRQDGMIAVHISNRYLDLEPVLAAIAHDEGLAALGNFDDRISDADARQGRWPSFWVVLARTGGSLDSLATRPGWRTLADSRRVSAWTDDYSNLVQVLRRQ